MGRVEQAVILAAGEGRRLRPFTALKPKVLIPVANKPILQYVIEALVGNGVRDLLLVVGYKKEQVQDYFGSGKDFGVDIDYVTQGQQLGTGHALKQVEGRVNDSFLVASGDRIVDAVAIEAFVGSEPNCMLVRPSAGAVAHRAVVVEDGEVKDLVTDRRGGSSRFISTGFYLFDREVFRFLAEELDLASAVRKMIRDGYRIAAHEKRATWLDVLCPWDIQGVNERVLQHISPSIGGTVERGVTLKGRVCIGEGTTVRANSYIVGPAVVGQNCSIGPGACIYPATSIGNGVVISAFTEVKNSVIGDHVEIGSSSTIEDSIIDRGSVLQGHFTARSGEVDIKVDGEYHRVRMGAMVGEGCTLANGVVVYPGISIGNRSHVKAATEIRENIEDETLVV